MPEFPQIAYREPLATIGASCQGTSTVADFLISTGAAFATSGTWPAINRALYIPVVVEDWITVYQMSILVATQSGNLDIGIYDEGGHRLVSSGSTAMGAAGIQLVNITDTVLAPGGYYLALSVDNTTAALQRRNDVAVFWESLGVKQEDLASVTLPTTATFAAPAAAYVPQLTAHLQATV